MTEEERGKRAFALNEQVKANEEMRRKLLANSAELFNEIYDNGYYKDLLGDEEGEWAGYLADLELFYSRNKIITLTAIYRKLTVKLGIPVDIWATVPISRLHKVLKVIDATNYPNWLAACTSLTTRDFKIELAKSQGKISEEDAHTHEQVLYTICKVCGLKRKYHGDTEEHTH